MCSLGFSGDKWGWHYKGGCKKNRGSTVYFNQFINLNSSVGNTNTKYDIKTKTSHIDSEVSAENCSTKFTNWKQKN